MNWCHTDILECTGSLTWKINRFSLCFPWNKEYLKSSNFCIKDKDSSWNRYELILYPNGKNEDSRSFLSVYLHRMPSLTDVDPKDNGNEKNGSVPVHDEEIVVEDKSMVKCTISILDSSGKKARTKEFSTMKHFTGINNFISRKDLYEYKDLLPNDQLTVLCTLTTLKSKRIKSHWNYSFSLLEECDRETISSLYSDLNLLMADTVFCDVILKAEDTEIPAHRAVLACRSPVFESMLKDNMDEKNAVVDTEVDPLVLKELVRYLYTDKCSFNNVDFSLKLLEVASKYGLNILKKRCAEYLKVNVTGSTVFDVVVAADKHGIAELRKSCIDLICQELPYMITTAPGWIFKFQSYPEIYSDIFDQLVKNEQPYKGDERL